MCKNFLFIFTNNILYIFPYYRKIEKKIIYFSIIYISIKNEQD